MYSTFDVLATPGLGLTVVCLGCTGEHAVVLTDPFDANLGSILTAANAHDARYHSD